MIKVFDNIYDALNLSFGNNFKSNELKLSQIISYFKIFAVKCDAILKVRIKMRYYKKQLLRLEKKFEENMHTFSKEIEEL